MTIHKILPKTVYEATNICEDQLENFETEIKSISGKSTTTPYFKVKTSHNVLQSIHRIAPFKNLTNNINYHIKKYLSEYGYPHHIVNNTKVNSMWFNIGTKGNYLFPHVHPGSFISGVFYIKTVPENIIHFYDPNKSPFAEPEILNEYSSATFTLKCNPASLLLFHSDLHHATPHQEMDGEKIVLSFNCILPPTIN
jgi:uncharacterized protein (TIGR02466 family)